VATFPRFNWPYDSPRQLTLCVVGGSASGVVQSHSFETVELFKALSY
jgi:hypothetical protein